MRQLIVAISLGIFYVGMSVVLGALSAQNALYWFLVPICGVGCAATGVGQLLQRVIPVPWTMKVGFAAPPRRVYLSWRAAVRMPAFVPFLFFPANLLWIASNSSHGTLTWTMAAILCAVGALAAAARWRRAFRVLRDGEVATALIDQRTDTSEAPWDLVYYHFVTGNGVTVSGSAQEKGYGVREGAAVPVFYDPNDPRRHVIACSSSFEAE
jgi:hypothetical protein